MTPTQQNDADDVFAHLLAEYDDGLQQGTVVYSEAQATPPELAPRLEEARTFLHLMEAVWPRQGKAPALSHVHAVPRTIGRFQIQRVLGRGGMGIVYLAHDPVLGREVALKVPRLEILLNPSLRRRFLREAKAAALLNHPNIIPTHEVGETDELCFIVYQYCPGPTLESWLRENPAPVGVAQAARLIETLAEAVAHAHQRGILHRDLKPANILLQTDEGRRMKDETTGAERNSSFILPPSSFILAKLTDFGLAKLEFEAEEATRTEAVLGTPAYMAPEQTRNARDLGPACDIWSLGAILYELLLQRRPFAASTPLEIMRHIQDREPVSPRSLRLDIPRDLETICLKCLAKDPAKRYGSAFELAADLRRFQEGKPVRARPTPWWERAWKWARRRPAAAALIVVLLLALAGAALGAGLYIARLEDLVAAAQREKDAKRREDALAARVSKEEALARRLQYVGDVRSAVQAIKEKNRDAAQLMLDRWPNPNLIDERGLEWFELKRQIVTRRPPNIVFAGFDHPGVKDKNELALASYAFAMSPDCRYAVTMRDRCDLEVYDAATWQPLCRIAGPGHKLYYQALAISADNRLVAAAANALFADGSVHPTVILWDWRKQIKLATCDFPDHGEATFRMDVAFTPKGDLLIVRVNHDLRCYAVAEFPKEIARYSGGPVAGAVLSPDGKHVALAHARNKTLEVRALPTLALTHAVPWNDAEQCIRMRFSRDGRLLALADRKLVHLIEMQGSTPKRLCEWGRDNLTAICFSPDGASLFAGSGAGSLEMMDCRTERVPYHDSGETISALIADPNGRHIYVRSNLGSVRVVEASWPPRPESIETKTGRVYALAYSPGGSLLASAGQGLGVRVWDPNTGKQIANLLCLSEIFSLAFSPDGKTLAAGGIEGFVHRWTVGTWQQLDPYQGHTDRVAGLAFTPDGARLLSMSWDKTCRLWGLADDTTAHVFHGPFDHFSGMALAPDGSEFAWLGDNDASIRVWRLERREERALPFVEKARAVCYSADGRWLAASDANGYLYLWDARAEKLVRRVESHSRGVRSLSFSPDGKVLASAGLDKVVKIWDTASFLELATLHGPADELRALVWSPDGKTLAAAGHDGKVWLWRAK